MTSTAIVELRFPDGRGSVEGKCPLGNRSPDQLADNDAAAIVLLALENPTVRSSTEKFMRASELTVTIKEDSVEVGLYFVCPIVKVAVPTSPALEEYW